MSPGHLWYIILSDGVDIRGLLLLRPVAPEWMLFAEMDIYSHHHPICF